MRTVDEASKTTGYSFSSDPESYCHAKGCWENEGLIKTKVSLPGDQTAELPLCRHHAEAAVLEIESYVVEQLARQPSEK